MPFRRQVPNSEASVILVSLPAVDRLPPLIFRLVPFSISTILSTYLIMEVVVGVPLLLLWCLFPILRLHDTVATPEEAG